MTEQIIGEVHIHLKGGHSTKLTIGPQGLDSGFLAEVTCLFGSCRRAINVAHIDHFGLQENVGEVGEYDTKSNEDGY